MWKQSGVAGRRSATATLRVPYNSFFDATRLHPDGEIDLSYSDDLGRHWVKGNGGVPLEPPNNASARQVGHVQDKQWVAVNHIVGNRYQDHVYAAWAVFNGQSTKVRMAVSRDRGQTFGKAVTISAPSQVGAAATYVLPEIDAAGNVSVSVVSFPPNGTPSTIYVARSTDDARTFGAFVPITTVTLPPGEVYPNTRFRSGIVESFAASPSYPGHLYLTYEDWDAVAGQADVKFTQSTDGGVTWTTPAVVNDNADAPGPPTDQFQPSVAAGPNGAVAVAFYDRRLPCPNDPSVLPADVGRTNFCVDTSLQAYKDNGGGAVPVAANVADLAIHLGSRAARPAPRRPVPVPLRGSHRPLRERERVPRRLLRAGDLEGNIYALMVSTHYPSTVTADEAGPVYYQQQVLATVPRIGLGPGY